MVIIRHNAILTTLPMGSVLSLSFLNKAEKPHHLCIRIGILGNSHGSQRQLFNLKMRLKYIITIEKKTV